MIGNWCACIAYPWVCAPHATGGEHRNNGGCDAGLGIAAPPSNMNPGQPKPVGPNVRLATRTPFRVFGLARSTLIRRGKHNVLTFELVQHGYGTMCLFSTTVMPQLRYQMNSSTGHIFLERSSSHIKGDDQPGLLDLRSPDEGRPILTNPEQI